MNVTRRGFLRTPLLVTALVPTGAAISSWDPMETHAANTGMVGVFARTAPVPQIVAYQNREQFRRVLRNELDTLERNVMRHYDRRG